MHDIFAELYSTPGCQTPFFGVHTKKATYVAFFISGKVFPDKSVGIY